MFSDDTVTVHFLLTKQTLPNVFKNVVLWLAATCGLITFLCEVFMVVLEEKQAYAFL